MKELVRLTENEIVYFDEIPTQYKERFLSFIKNKTYSVKNNREFIDSNLFFNFLDYLVK